MPIQRCTSQSDLASPGAIWAQLKPKQPLQKPIPVHTEAHFSPRGPKSAQVIGLYWPWLKESNYVFTFGGAKRSGSDREKK